MMTGVLPKGEARRAMAKELAGKREWIERC